MSGGIATSTQNTLSKLGAHLRWQLEKCGLDAERDAVVTIVVESEVQRSKLISGFLAGYDRSVMRRDDGQPGQIVLHGVRVAVVVREMA